MWLDPFWSFLEETVFSIPSVLEGTRPLFNPYHDTNPDFDLPQAAAIRQANLSSFLDSLPERPPVLLVGEAPGWHGCRFSGIPFTSELQLSNGILPFQRPAVQPQRRAACGGQRHDLLAGAEAASPAILRLEQRALPSLPARRAAIEPDAQPAGAAKLSAGAR